MRRRKTNDDKKMSFAVKTRVDLYLNQFSQRAQHKKNRVSTSGSPTFRRKKIRIFPWIPLSKGSGSVIADWREELAYQRGEGGHSPLFWGQSILKTSQSSTPPRGGGGAPGPKTSPSLRKKPSQSPAPPPPPHGGPKSTHPPPPKKIC